MHASGFTTCDRTLLINTAKHFGTWSFISFELKCICCWFVMWLLCPLADYPYCGNLSSPIVYDGSGSLNSPFHPEAYPNNANCHWRLRASIGVSWITDYQYLISCVIDYSCMSSYVYVVVNLTMFRSPHDVKHPRVTKILVYSITFHFETKYFGCFVS